MTAKVLGWAYAALLGVLFVYATVAAVGNLTGMVGSLGELLGPVGHALLIAGVGVPVLGLVIALLIGRSRSGGTKLLLLTAALCTVAAVQLELLHLLTPRLDQLFGI